MRELRRLLENNDRVRIARLLLILRRVKSQGIIRFNAPLNLYRTSWSMTALFHFSDLLFHLLKIITCSKHWKGVFIVCDWLKFPG